MTLSRLLRLMTTLSGIDKATFETDMPGYMNSSVFFEKLGLRLSPYHLPPMAPAATITARAAIIKAKAHFFIS